VNATAERVDEPTARTTEPLDYASPARSPTRGAWVTAVLSLVFSGLGILIAAEVFIEAMTIHDAGRYRPGVSFSGSLSLKAYHVQRPTIVWCLPVTGLILGVLSVRRRDLQGLGWRSIVISCVTLVGMIAMELYW